MLSDPPGILPPPKAAMNAALREDGVIVVDDMDLARHADEQRRSALAEVRHCLL